MLEGQFNILLIGDCLAFSVFNNQSQLRMRKRSLPESRLMRSLKASQSRSRNHRGSRRSPWRCPRPSSWRGRGWAAAAPCCCWSWRGWSTSCWWWTSSFLAATSWFPSSRLASRTWRIRPPDCRHWWLAPWLVLKTEKFTWSLWWQQWIFRRWN